MWPRSTTPAMCGRAPGSSTRRGYSAAPASGSASSRRSAPSASTGRTASTAPTCWAGRPPAGSCTSSLAISSELEPRALRGMTFTAKTLRETCYEASSDGVGVARPSRRGGGAGWGAGAPVAAFAQDRVHQLAADPAADARVRGGGVDVQQGARGLRSEEHTSDSSHLVISYAVFCLKKKKNKNRRV